MWFRCRDHLRLAGSESPIFSQNALCAIYQVSAGICRIINKLTKKTLAIGALGRAILYRYSKIGKKEKDRQIRRNLKIFAWITLLQFGVGTWFWLTMPADVWKSFMGGSLFATAMMVTGWIVALLILHSAFTGRFTAAMILGGIEVLVMVVVRDLARMAYLREIFHASQLENVGESSPLIAFLLVFAVGLFALYYMISLMFKAKTPQP